MKTVFTQMAAEINTVFKAKALVATYTMIYVCIDFMAYLNCTSVKSTKNDFINWVEEFLKQILNNHINIRAKISMLHDVPNYMHILYNQIMEKKINVENLVIIQVLNIFLPMENPISY